MIESIKRIGVFSLAMLLSVAAEAAILDAIEGGVLVSRNGGPYQVVRQPTELKIGDSVIANPGGGARLVYANGCAVAVRPGMVLTVNEAPPTCTAEVPPEVTSDEWGTGTALAVGAAVVGGGVGIALAVGGGGGGGGGTPASGN